ncbi:hypothetical protein BDC45DRAFT_289362 [Circinella umbellata]|nr:hypothetical protein BDC45DRAFT_289362 [Circinella umbellata]
MSYINSLNLLGTDPPNDISEETLTEELSLWANAQFTFDTEPGSALLDDLNNETKSPSTHKSDPNDLFATLTEFGHHHQQQSYLQPTPTTPTSTNSSTIATTATTTTTTTTNNYILPHINHHHQQHLPRIAPAPGLHMGITNDPTWSLSSSPMITPVVTPSTSTTSTSNKNTNARKRKQSSVDLSSKTTTNHMDDLKDNLSIDDDSSSDKVHVEEDKRRRNTAASARFRMKKKLREQALEQTAKEMSIKAEGLEKRVKELEMEAKWLRALVVEKDPKLLDLVTEDDSTAVTTSTTST